MSTAIRRGILRKFLNAAHPLHVDNPEGFQRAVFGFLRDIGFHLRLISGRPWYYVEEDGQEMARAAAHHEQVPDRVVEGEPVPDIKNNACRYKAGRPAAISHIPPEGMEFTRGLMATIASHPMIR